MHFLVGMNNIISKQRLKIRALLLRGSASGGVVTILAAGIALLVEVVLARILGKEQYGIYVYAITIAGALTLVARLGRDLAILRFAPGYLVNDKWDLLRGLIRHTQAAVISVSLTLCIVAIMATIFVSDSMDPGIYPALVIAILSVPIAAIGYVFQFINRAFKRVVLAMLPLNVIAPLLLIMFTITADNIFERGLLAHDAVIGNLASLLAAVVFMIMIYQRSIPAPLKHAIPSFNVQEWRAVAITLFFVAGAHQITNQADLIMLSVLTGTDFAGLYKAATQVALLAAFPLYITNIIGVPMISELYASNRLNDLQYLLRIIVRLTTLATLVIVAMLIFSGEWILGFFGEDFTQSYSVMTLLILGQAINTMSGAANALLVQAGHHKAAAIIVTLAAVVNIILNFLLIPPFGMVGAALATTISLAGWNIGMVLYARRNLKLDPSIFCLLRRQSLAEKI